MATQMKWHCYFNIDNKISGETATKKQNLFTASGVLCEYSEESMWSINIMTGK